MSSYTATKLRSPLKRHGGKYYLARRIIAHFPPHAVYVEPFLGGGSVLLNKQPSPVEVAGDVEGDLVRFWQIVGGPDEAFETFYDRVRGTVYNVETFDTAARVLDAGGGNDPLLAWAYLVRNRMSRSALGKDFAWSQRLRGGQPEQLNSWQTTTESLRAVRGRLTRSVFTLPRVKILHRPAVEVVREFGTAAALVYADPPYLHETRTHKKAYHHEMNRTDHEQLLECLLRTPADVFLSGYRSALYDAALVGWDRLDFDMPNHSGQGATKQRRTECLWVKPSRHRPRQLALFD